MTTLAVPQTYRYWFLQWWSRLQWFWRPSEDLSGILVWAWAEGQSWGFPLGRWWGVWAAPAPSVWSTAEGHSQPLCQSCSVSHTETQTVLCMMGCLYNQIYILNYLCCSLKPLLVHSLLYHTDYKIRFHEVNFNSIENNDGTCKNKIHIAW